MPKVVVDVRAAGHIPLRRTVEVASDARTVVSVTLVREPPPPSEGHTAAGPAVAKQGEAARTMSPSTDDRRINGIVALGVAGALGVVGVVAWRVHEGEAATYGDDARCRFGALSRDERCNSHADAARVALGIEIGAFALGGAAALLSAWWLATPKRATSGKTASGGCAPTLTGLVCHGM